MEPHPLDFDWRFNKDTSARLSKLISAHPPVLCVGTPTIARNLEDQNVDYISVDRRPVPDLKAHQRTSVGSNLKLGVAPGCAVIDPPWYPEHLEYWATWTAKYLASGQKIFASVWPAETRPNATLDLETVLSKFSTWATVDRDVLELSYQLPTFEAQAMKARLSEQPLSPLVGELIAITVRNTPTPSASPYGQGKWIRYSFGQHQLAVLDDGIQTDERNVHIQAVDGSIDSIWPQVSKRAANRECIHIWSSKNEVAVVRNARRLIELIDTEFDNMRRGQEPNWKNLPRELQQWNFTKFRQGFTDRWEHQS